MRRHGLLLLAGALCAGEALAADHVVVIEHMRFEPAVVNARVGDTVEWRNRDVVPHTATAERAGFDAVLAAQEKKATRLERSGSFEVICRYHPGMTLELKVTGGAP